MKILMICNFEKGQGSGAETFCYNLSSELATQNNLKVHTIYGSHKKDSLSPMTLLRVNNKILRKLFFDYVNPYNIHKLSRILDELSPDLVHFHNVYGLSSSLIHFTSNRLNIPTVVTIHDYWPICFFSTMMRHGKPCSQKCNRCFFPFGYLNKRIRSMHLSNAILVAPSRFMKNILLNHGFKRVVLIPNGIPLSKEVFNGTKKEISSDTVNILFLGRLEYVKGITFLPYIFKRLANGFHGKNIFFNIVGSGSGYLWLKRVIENEHFSNVRLYGRIPDDVLIQVLQESHILIFPSVFRENFPMTLLEVSAFGIPTVAFNLGGVSDIIIDGVNGFLVQPFDIRSFIRRIKDLIANPELYTAMSKNSKNIAKLYSIDNIAKKYVNLYKFILNY